MSHLKKEFTKSSLLVLYLSLILIIGSFLQISSTDFFENNDDILFKIPSIYAQDNGGNGNGVDNGEDNGDFGDNGGDVSDDNGDSDEVEVLSLEETPEDEEEVRQEDTPEELTLSEDGGSEVLTLRQEDKDAGEVLTLDGEDETEPTGSEPTGPEPTCVMPECPSGNVCVQVCPEIVPGPEPTGPEPSKVENDTSLQEAEQKAPPQVVAGVADKDDEEME